jgi:glycosyltransferase involved in cell wall biosynthesis
LVVDAATRLGVGLDVVGDGPARAGLQARAGRSVTLHGRLDDDQVISMFQACRAYCMPGQEDFGITLVEAQAAGKPVIAFAGGGALETVVDGVTGVFFDRQDTESVVDAIRRCEHVDTGPERIAARAARFSTERFREDLCQTIAARLGGSARDPCGGRGTEPRGHGR